MEKINIAELLKNCPTGMELDCTMYDGVTLFSVDDKEETVFPIKGITRDGLFITLTKYGQFISANSAKCIIFPKGKTTWEGFQRPFKDGDIIYCRDEYSDKTFTYVAIFKQIEKGEKIQSHCFYNFEDDYFSTYDFLYDGYNTRFATEEEKEKLFKAIKDNGYRWNAETKTLEKLIEPKFKVGDRVKHISAHTPGIVVKVVDKGYYIDYPKGNGVCYISFILEKDYELLPNKFDITTLKPFESRVLVRDFNNDTWRPSMFGAVVPKALSFVVVGGLFFGQCIPYDGNEHLLGKTDDCDEYYKTWE